MRPTPDPPYRADVRLLKWAASGPCSVRRPDDAIGSCCDGDLRPAKRQRDGDAAVHSRHRLREHHRSHYRLAPAPRPGDRGRAPPSLRKARRFLAERHPPAVELTSFIAAATCIASAQRPIRLSRQKQSQFAIRSDDLRASAGNLDGADSARGDARGRPGPAGGPRDPRSRRTASGRNDCLEDGGGIFRALISRDMRSTPPACSGP